jgi:hypothetical protein
MQAPSYPPPSFPTVQAKPPKRRRRWPWVLVGIAATFIVLIGGCAALVGGAVKQASDNAAHVAAGGVSSGLGAKDATADVGTPTMTAPDAIGFSYVEMPVTNHSSGRSDYFIEMAIDSADGQTQLDTTTALVSNLEAGQSTTAKSLPVDAKSIPTDAVVRVTTVQRTASN